jgi:hypothetical protein
MDVHLKTYSRIRTELNLEIVRLHFFTTFSWEPYVSENQPVTPSDVPTLKEIKYERLEESLFQISAWRQVILTFFSWFYSPPYKYPEDNLNNNTTASFHTLTIHYLQLALSFDAIQSVLPPASSNKPQI